MDLIGKSFLVTGGSGFVGSYLVDQLVGAGATEIVVFDAAPRPENVARALETGNVRIVEGDVTDPASVRAAMTGIDGVFHLAVLPLAQSEENPRACLDVNAVGAFNVFQAAQQGGVEKIVFSSASAVYGDTDETMDESHPLNAKTMYGASKVAAEYFLRAFGQRGIDYVILRYMNVYGPRQAAGLIPAVLARIRDGEPPVVMGDGSQAFDFVHVADVASANTRAMASDVTGAALNVGSATEVTVRGIVEELLRLTGSDLRPEFRHDANVLMTRRVGSNARAVELLGWRPSYGLADGLRTVIESGFPP
jgi:UDP-glucose 4-epimerase